MKKYRFFLQIKLIFFSYWYNIVVVYYTFTVFVFQKKYDTKGL
jgi:hypothetical protein